MIPRARRLLWPLGDCKLGECPTKITACKTPVAGGTRRTSSLIVARKCERVPPSPSLLLRSIAICETSQAAGRGEAPGGTDARAGCGHPARRGRTPRAQVRHRVPVYARDRPASGRGRQAAAVSSDVAELPPLTRHEDPKHSAAKIFVGEPQLLNCPLQLITIDQNIATPLELIFLAIWGLTVADRLDQIAL